MLLVIIRYRNVCVFTITILPTNLETLPERSALVAPKDIEHVTKLPVCEKSILAIWTEMF